MAGPTSLLWMPDPADHLLLLLIRACRWDVLPPIRWETDAMILLLPPGFDWPRLVTTASQRGWPGRRARCSTTPQEASRSRCPAGCCRPCRQPWPQPRSRLGRQARGTAMSARPLPGDPLQRSEGRQSLAQDGGDRPVPHELEPPTGQALARLRVPHQRPGALHQLGVAGEGHTTG